jgi:hypothetical protein
MSRIEVAEGKMAAPKQSKSELGARVITLTFRLEAKPNPLIGHVVLPPQVDLNLEELVAHQVLFPIPGLPPMLPCLRS